MTLGSFSQYFWAQPRTFSPYSPPFWMMATGQRAWSLASPAGAKLSGLLQAVRWHLWTQHLRLPLVGNEPALGVAKICLWRHVLGELAVKQHAQLVLLEVADDQRQALAVAAVGIDQRLIGDLLAHVARELHGIAPAVGKLLGHFKGHGPAPAAERRQRGIESEVRRRLSLEPSHGRDRDATIRRGGLLRRAHTAGRGTETGGQGYRQQGEKQHVRSLADGFHGKFLLIDGDFELRFTGSLPLSRPPGPHNCGAREFSFVAALGVVNTFAAVPALFIRPASPTPLFAPLSKIPAGKPAPAAPATHRSAPLPSSVRNFLSRLRPN